MSADKYQCIFSRQMEAVLSQEQIRQGSSMARAQISNPAPTARVLYRRSLRASLVQESMVGIKVNVNVSNQFFLSKIRSNTN